MLNSESPQLRDMIDQIMENFQKMDLLSGTMTQTGKKIIAKTKPN